MGNPIVIADQSKAQNVNLVPQVGQRWVDSEALGTIRTVLGAHFVGTTGIAGGAAGTNLFSIENPLLSGVRVYLVSFSINILGLVAPVSGSVALGRTTATPTGGSVNTAQRRSLSDSAPAGIVRTGPTATLAAGRMAVLFSVGTAAELVVRTFKPEPGYAIVLAQGEGLLLRGVGITTDNQFEASLEWFEASPA